MHCIKQIKQDIYWVGASDRRLALFENVYPIPNGVSYNAYLVLDEKTVLLDTTDRSVSEQFFENVAYALGGRKLDYVIVDHMEPDHASTLAELVLHFPEVTIVTNAKVVTMIKNYFSFDIDSRVKLVKEGEVLETGRHRFTFVMAPMVHWPEVMVTYDLTEKILFSADAFGSFGALNGHIFADEVDFERDWLDDARRYYINIVGKYGTQVQALLKKAAGLEIAMICPLHGLVWREHISWILDKQVKWATYQPEDNAVMIAYASVYGHTENAVNILASKLADAGVRDIRMYDVSVTHPSYIVSEAFRCSHIVFASTTYNAGIFVNMENLLHDLWAHAFQNRTVAIMENGSWAPTSGKLMRELLSSLKNITILDNSLTIRSALKESQLSDIDAMAQSILISMGKQKAAPAQVVSGEIDATAMYKFSYGLFVLTSQLDGRDNGCIINTAQQLTGNPYRITIAVNKSNYSNEIIKKTGVFNISVLATDADFGLFKRFGFASGRDTDKLAGFDNVARSANGLTYITGVANAMMSAKVIESYDYGTHTLFVAEVTEAKTLSDAPSMTYAYYFANVKPKPVVVEEKKGWVCKICGYVYEEEELPADYECPLCKHPASDFERL